jgi:hypothetical protein
MRLVSGFEVVNHLLGILLILATAGVTLGLWMQGQVGVGAVAAATAMALRLNGISHWVMWEMASLFEHVGTVQDGMNTLSRPHAVVDRPGAVPLQVTRAPCISRTCALPTVRPAQEPPRSSTGSRCRCAPARRSAWSGARAPARARW